MTEGALPSPRRILVGIGDIQHLQVTIDAAVMLASGFGTALQCVVVEQEDLVAFARLPFARAYGRGGMTSAVTADSVEGYFRRVARTVEHALVERCSRVNVSWSLARPQGDYIRELMASVEQDDVVVVNRRDIPAGAKNLPSVIKAMLGKAAAVVISPAGLPQHGNVLALSGGEIDGKALALARYIASATGRGLDVASPMEFLASKRRASIVVAPVALAELAGEAAFLRSIDAMGAATILI